MHSLDTMGSSSELTAVLLCGGRGSRLTELTDDILPKSLVKVLGKELIRYSIDPILERPVPVAHIVFAIGHLCEQIIDWVNSADINIPYSFSEQEDPGIVGGIRSAAARVPAQSYLICNTDEIRKGIKVDEVFNTHRKHKLMGTIVATQADNLYRHRVLTINEDNVVTGSMLKNPAFKDGPLLRGNVNTGLIIADQIAIQQIDTASYGHDWSAFIDPLYNSGQLAAHFDSIIQYYNVGTIQEYVDATESQTVVST